MSPQQQSVIDTIREIYRNTYSPAKTVAIAQRCYLSPRHMRRKLVELEKIGAVKRVGYQSGWLLAA